MNNLTNKELIKLADKNDMKACLILAERYFNYTHKYINDAIKYYEQYLSLNFIDNEKIDCKIAYKLARLYLTSKNIDKNIDNVINLLTLAGSEVVEANLILFAMYSLGIFIKPNYLIANKYFYIGENLSKKNKKYDDISFLFTYANILHYGIGEKVNQSYAYLNYFNVIISTFNMINNSLYKMIKTSSNFNEKINDEYKKLSSNSVDNMNLYYKYMHEVLAKNIIKKNLKKRTLSDVAKLNIRATSKLVSKGDSEAIIKMYCYNYIKDGYKKAYPMLVTLADKLAKKHHPIGEYLLAKLNQDDIKIALAHYKNFIMLLKEKININFDKDDQSLHKANKAFEIAISELNKMFAL